VAFAPKNWRDFPDITTPITAEALEDVETRLSDYTDDSLTALRANLAINVKDYGAVGDGTTDDTSTIQAALTAGAGRVVWFPATASFYKTTATLTVPANTVVAGDGGGAYWDAGGGSLIKKTNGNTGGNTVFQPATDCTFRNLRIEAVSLPYYLAAIWPTRPNNPSYGIYSADGNGLTVENVTLAGFALAGIGGSGYEVPRLHNVLAYQNLYGVNWTANDAQVDGCVFRHNVHTGYRNAGTSDSISGGRAEWNARYGIESAGRLVLGGAARIDRNGWAGVNMVSGAWGCVLGNCEFFRNGAGGDSVYGRVGAITTTATDPDGNVMYLAPASELDKAHIRADTVKYMICVGTRFVAGADDSNAGARSPKYVYGLKDVDEVVLMNQDRIGWQRNTADLGAADYREGAGQRVYTTGSVAYGGIEWQSAIALFPGVVYSASYFQSAGGGAGTGAFVFGSGGAESISRLGTGSLGANADFSINQVGKGLLIKEGSNAKMGVATLSAGSVVVSTTAVTANSRIFLTKNSGSSTGSLRVSARTAGTSFTITSSDAADTGTVAWMIVEPSA
jgi:hypothetical protein